MCHGLLKNAVREKVRMPTQRQAEGAEPHRRYGHGVEGLAGRAGPGPRVGTVLVVSEFAGSRRCDLEVWEWSQPGIDLGGWCVFH